MARLKQPDIRVVLGRGGSGKSTLVRSWLERIKGRVLIFDTAAEPENAAGAVVTDRPVELVASLIAGDPKICWRGLDPGAFELVNRAAWSAEDLTLVWEEADAFLDAGARPEWAFKIISQGRHRGIRLIACSRRPARVSRDLTANASRIVSFKMTEPRDLAYLGEYMGSEAAASLPQLAPYHALDWSERGAKVKKSPFA